MKNTTILSSGSDLYAVDFHGKASHIIFNGGETGTLGKLCANYGKNGIMSISRYNASEMNFDKLSKSLVSQLFNHDTHSFIELKKTNFI